MTALKEYQRLEASGLWRAGPDHQRREVVVSIGDATLVITDLQDRALTHWSLAAIQRQNPGAMPATYSPDGDPGETLELNVSETAMIEAIERLRRAVDRARPHPGRLRGVGAILSAAAVLALAFFWLPGAVLRHTVTVVPPIKRAEIGADLLERIQRASGQPCASPASNPALARLAGRTGAATLVVVQGGVAESLTLPGGYMLLNKSLVEDHEDPAVVAGYILAEKARNQETDALRVMLEHAGAVASFRLLTTGSFTRETLDDYAEHLLLRPPAAVAEEAVLAEFAAASIPSTPYAYARDVTGETVLGLIEADPMTGKTPQPILRDRDWLLVQDICGG
ncbi:MAG: hypothetical protein AAGA05_12675 [Pseudomonadota bacterium]